MSNIHDRIDKMTADADWKEGINAFRAKINAFIRDMDDEIEEMDTLKEGVNAFRAKISNEITEIYQSIAELRQEIEKIKETL